jgi:hypothetical protein
VPGAETNLAVDRHFDRGVRRPTHKGLVASQPRRFLRPWACVPVRPGETLAAASVVGDTMFNSVVQLQNLPLTYAELGMFYVPYTVLPEWMRAIIIGTQVDFRNQGDIGGTTVNQTDDPIAAQGHDSVGLQQRVRQWAGEIGGDQTSALAESSYAPFVSHSLWQIAEDWYSVSVGDRDNDDLFQQEPVVDTYVRGATATSFDVGLAALDLDSGATGVTLSQLVEKMFLLTQTETTWAQYLADHGIDPRRLRSSMSIPLMTEHAYLGPMGGHQFAHGAQDASLGDVETTGFSPTLQAEQHTVDPPGPASTSIWDSRAIGTIGHKWSMKSGSMLKFDQPGFLVGTLVWWGEDGSADEYGHHFDATRLINPGMWGHRAHGGIDEMDFIGTQHLYGPDGTTLQSGSEPDQSGNSIINMLNLWLHGEVAAPLGTDFFRYRRPYGSVLNEGNIRCSSRLSGNFSIISDMVAG